MENILVDVSVNSAYIFGDNPALCSVVKHRSPSVSQRLTIAITIITPLGTENAH